MNLNIDVISDVICPWCYVGKRRLEKAIAALHASSVDDPLHVQVQWHPFQLNPSMPKAGVSRKEYRTTKFGSWERSEELDAQLTAVGESEGLCFAFDKIQRTPNTVDAHRLIWFAGEQGCQDEVVEALFRAYFCEGGDIGNRNTLTELGAKSGLDRQATEIMLNSDAGNDEIVRGQQLSRQHGVSGVPFFLVNGIVSLSGAQAPEAFAEAFEQAAA